MTHVLFLSHYILLCIALCDDKMCLIFIEEYRPELTSSYSMMRLIAFCMCLIKLLGTAFSTLRLQRYKEFNKRVGRCIRYVHMCNVYMCVSVLHAHICVHDYMYAHVCAQTHAHTRTHIHVHTHARAHTNILYTHRYITEYSLCH